MIHLSLQYAFPLHGRGIPTLSLTGQYGEKTGSDLVKIAQVATIDPAQCGNAYQFARRNCWVAFFPKRRANSSRNGNGSKGVESGRPRELEQSDVDAALTKLLRHVNGSRIYWSTNSPILESSRLTISWGCPSTCPERVKP